MKDEYDFSKGERSKFYIPAEKIRLPYYFDSDVERRLCIQAERIGKTPADLAQAIIENELKLIESLR